MKRVFVCSPLRPTPEFSLDENIGLAKRLCRAACRDGVAPFAPHLFYTQFLEEDVPTDREQGIECGLQWLLRCNELWVYSEQYSTCSSGMKMEIDFARTTNIEVVYMPDAWEHVEKRRPTSMCPTCFDTGKILEDHEGRAGYRKCPNCLR